MHPEVKMEDNKGHVAVSKKGVYNLYIFSNYLDTNMQACMCVYKTNVCV